MYRRFLFAVLAYYITDVLWGVLESRTLALFGLMMGFFLFVQLWFPFLPLYTIAYMHGTSLLHTFVVNDEKEEYKRGLEEAARM